MTRRAMGAPRPVSAAELRAFLLDRLGLRGPFWTVDQAAEGARALAMWQIDSIRVTGLRNQELAWVSRSETPPAHFYALVHGERAFLETHYPVFAVRRDWVPLLIAAFTSRSQRGIEERRRLRPTMRRLLEHIRDHGSVTVAQFDAERIPGGFNTLKATTKALDYLWTDRALQISGRTRNFHREFDLTDRVAPELAAWRAPGKRAYEDFLLRSALAVLKVGTADQIADRVRLHYGEWRGSSIRDWRALVAARLPEVAVPVRVTDLPDEPVYWFDPAEAAAWEAAATPAAPMVRSIAPLDMLLYSRRRFSALFGLDYKFEAYTPVHQRRFYFALPILFDDRVVGLLDAVRNGSLWRVRGLELRDAVPPEALREGIHRLAGIAGAEEVAIEAPVPRALARALAGRVRR